MRLRDLLEEKPPPDPNEKVRAVALGDTADQDEKSDVFVDIGDELDQRVLNRPASSSVAPTPIAASPPPTDHVF